MQQFGDVLPFVQRRLQVADNRAATLTQIEEMLTDPLCKASLQIQLAAVVDAGTPMVQSTYILGDGTFAWQCYEQLSYIENCIRTAYLPNLIAVPREISAGDPHTGQQMYQRGIAAIQPGWITSTRPS